MLEQTVYHGTEISRGYRMLSNKKMDVTRGDKHWLGDGSYFFEEDFFGYKWILDMYVNYFKHKPKDDNELFKSYGIIEGKLSVVAERVFNLDTFKHKSEFDRVYDKCKSLQQYSERFGHLEIPDGVVLNIMFLELDYGVDFDVVVCTFRQKGNKYAETNMRLNYIPQKQICIKKDNCIAPIKFFDCSDKLEEYKRLMMEYNKEFEKTKKTTYTYSRFKKKMY